MLTPTSVERPVPKVVTVMIQSIHRRAALTVLLVAEGLYLGSLVVVLLVPWDVSLSEFDGEPVSTTEAYVHAAPFLVVLVAIAGAVACLWVRGGGAGRKAVMVVSALHVAGALWLLASLDGFADEGLRPAAALLVAYSALLAVLARRDRHGSTAPAESVR